jgi:cobalt/nickel transport system permease protein
MHLHDDFSSVAHSNGWSGYRVKDKGMFCGALLVSVFVLPPGPAVLSVAAAASLAALLGAGVRWRMWVRSLAPMMAFSLAGVLPLLLADPGEAAVAAARTFSAGSALVLLFLTTPVEEVLAAAPSGAVLGPWRDLALLTLRASRVSRGAFGAALQAWRLRSGPAGWRRLGSACQAIAAAAFRSFDRAGRMDQGLRLRGGDGTLQLWTEERTACPALCWFAAGVIVVAAAWRGWQL